jgi:hypothetical protein
MFTKSQPIDYTFSVDEFAYIMASVAARSVGFEGEEVDAFANKHAHEYMPAALALAKEPSEIMKSMKRCAVEATG